MKEKEKDEFEYFDDLNDEKKLEDLPDIDETVYAEDPDDFNSNGGIL